MAKAATAKRKAKASKPKLSDKEQSGRFVEAARKLGIAETGEQFERAVEKIALSRIDIEKQS